MKNLIIYDFDGVLVDSRYAVYQYYDAILTHFGFQPANWEDESFSSKAMGMSHQQFISQYTRDEKLVQDMMDYVPQYTFEQLITATPLMPGAKEAIPLYSKDYKLAICTNRGDSVSDYLDYYGLIEYFSIIVTAKDVKTAKPSPEGTLKILSALDLTPEHAVFVGDNEVDYHAATHASVDFVAFNKPIFGSRCITNHNDLLHFL